MCLFIPLTSFAALLSFYDLTVAAVRIHDLSALGWEDISEFRAYIPTVGGNTRIDALSLLISLLPATCVAPKIFASRHLSWDLFCFLTQAMLILAMLTSFESGIYVSLAVFLCIECVLSFLYLRSRSLVAPMFRWCIATIAVACATLTNLRSSILKTLYLSRSVGHQRSMSGRLSLWRSSLPRIENHKWLGDGGYCTSLSSGGYLVNLHLPFSPRVYNGTLQVFEQNGIIGLIVVVAFVVLCTARCCKCLTPDANRPQAQHCACILIAGISALLISDQCYASVPLSPINMWTFFILTGMLSSMPDTEGWINV